MKNLLTCKENSSEFLILQLPQAFDLFRRHIVKLGYLPEGIEYALLPSTSPAYTLSAANKTIIWKNHLAAYLAKTIS